MLRRCVHDVVLHVERSAAGSPLAIGQDNEGAGLRLSDRRAGDRNSVTTQSHVIVVMT